MGRQVNFYMAAKDEQEFVDFVRSRQGTVVFKSMQWTPEIIPLDVLPSAREPFWFSLCLWDKNICSPPVLCFVKEQGYYHVDEIVSEVVQFHRSFLDHGRLSRGRIWAEVTYWNLKDTPPTTVKKSEAFIKWYEQLARWIKRRSVRRAPMEYLLAWRRRFCFPERSLPLSRIHPNSKADRRSSLSKTIFGKEKPSRK